MVGVVALTEPPVSPTNFGLLEHHAAPAYLEFRDELWMATLWAWKMI